jgi:hypothetical protein
MYLYNWNTNQFDLMPDERIGSPAGRYSNTFVSPFSYLYCTSGTFGKCYVTAKILGGSGNNTHLWDVYIYVQMSP